MRENGDAKTLVVTPNIRFPASSGTLPSETELLIAFTCSVNNSARVMFTQADGSVAATTTVYYTRFVNGTLTPAPISVTVTGVRERGSSGVAPVLVTCATVATPTAGSTTSFALSTVWLGFEASITVLCRCVCVFLCVLPSIVCRACPGNAINVTRVYMYDMTL